MQRPSLKPHWVTQDPFLDGLCNGVSQVGIGEGNARSPPNFGKPLLSSVGA